MSTGYHRSSFETYPQQTPLFGEPAQKPKTLEERLKEAEKIKANLQAKTEAAEKKRANQEKEKLKDPQPPNTGNKKGGKHKRRTHKRKGRKTMTRRRR